MTTLIRYRATGGTRRVANFVAKRLVNMRIADYVEVEAPVSRPVPRKSDPVVQEVKQVVEEVESQAEAQDELDALGEEELRALAKERGVKVHHKAGADKIRAALREAE